MAEKPIRLLPVPGAKTHAAIVSGIGASAMVISVTGLAASAAGFLPGWGAPITAFCLLISGGAHVVSGALTKTREADKSPPQVAKIPTDK
jgi:hypothetical protein